eukprot:5577875-Pleurochrysis_carterae.AAC.7
MAYGPSAWSYILKQLHFHKYGHSGDPCQCHRSKIQKSKRFLERLTTTSSEDIMACLRRKSAQ